jgi:hypothetical protein
VITSYLEVKMPVYLKEVVRVLVFVMVARFGFLCQLWEGMSLKWKTLTISPNRWKRKMRTKTSGPTIWDWTMDPRIKQLKCIACKVSVSAHHREAVDLMLTSCERNNTHVQSRLGRCPFRQMVETLDADYEKEKQPKKQEIPRLLDMRHAPKQACNDNPYAESNCPEAGPHCQHGACGPCLEGEVEGPVQASAPVVEPVSKVPRIIVVDDKAADVECDDIICMSITKKGQVVEWQIGTHVTK